MPKKAAAAKIPAGNSAQQTENAADYSSSIETAGPQLSRMIKDLTMVSDLWGGTEAMRRARRNWLPQEPAEEDDRYEVRVGRSFLFNGFKRSVRQLTGRPFSKQIELDDTLLPATFLDWANDIDLQGHDVHVWGKSTFQDGVRDGITHWLVEYPDTTGIENAAQELPLRPYFVNVDARNLIAVKWRVDAGKPVLTQVRYKEVVTEEIDRFSSKEVCQIRVLEPGKWETWRKMENDPKNRWQKTGGGATSLDFIPLVTFAPGSTGAFQEAEVPLIDLAWENVAHWQSLSDQKNILHVARCPIWFGKGINETDERGTKKRIKVSSNAVLLAEDTQADFKIVEHSGQSIGAGRADIIDSENRMEYLAAQPLVMRQRSGGAGAATATESLLDAEVQYCDLAVMAMNFADCLSRAFWIMGQYTKDKVEEKRLVTINTDFGIAARDAADLQALLSARTAREITQKTFLEEYKRRNVLSISVDVDDEIAQTAAEAPRFSAIADGTATGDAAGGTGGDGGGGPDGGGAAGGAAAGG